MELRDITLLKNELIPAKAARENASHWEKPLHWLWFETSRPRTTFVAFYKTKQKPSTDSIEKKPTARPKVKPLHAHFGLFGV